ncbi:hypothetical protein D3C73_1031350 [compost metagenome]
MAAFALHAVLGRQGQQAFGQLLGAGVDGVHEARGGQGIKHGHAHGGGQRVAVVRAALIAVREHAGVLAGQQCGQRHAAADALGQRHDVGRDVGMLVGEHLAGAAHAGLDFVHDQQQLVLVGQLAQALHELLGSGEDAAFTLHRFQHDGDGLVVDQLLHRFQVVQFGLGEAFHLRGEHLVPARLARCGHRGQRAAVEAVVHGDDLVGAVLLDLAPLARQLDGAFVGFAAAVGEEDAVKAGRAGQALGQLDRGNVVERR